MAHPYHHALASVKRWGGEAPLFWEHVNPYGRVQFDMDARLPIN